MIPPPRFVFPALLVILLACACRGGDPRTVAAEPPGEVLREFEAVCREIAAGPDEYYGTAQVTALEDRLRQPSIEPGERVSALTHLGMERLRLGEVGRAVESLTEAERLAEREGLDPALRSAVIRRLGLAPLRDGEQSNCVGMHGPESCIVPFGADALHRDPRGSLAAIEQYKRYLAMKPASPEIVWLLNVAAMTVDRYPDEVPERFRLHPDAFRSGYDVKRFRNVAWEVGIRIVQPSGGGIMDDFDGDGLLDIVSSTIDPCGPMNYFRNNGDGTFENRSAQSKLASQLGGLNTIHADYDNDGDLDLFVLRGGWFEVEGQIRNSLLRNGGAGIFEDVTRGAGLAEPAYPTQAGAWADYDNDGDLDLYIGNEIEAPGRPYPSQLFRNNGDGTFTDVAEAAGVRNDRMAKAVAWGDYDNDGDPDLYVSNIGANRLYRNDGDGTFTDVAPDAGVTEPESRSFPTWFFDYDNDGFLDIFVADYGASLADVALGFLGRHTGRGHPRLYRNLGQGRFRDVSRDVGLIAATLPMGSNYGDLDNDGFLDFYLGVGTPSYESIAPNLMYRNDRGRRFQDVTYSGGFGHLQKGHGVAFGDIDNDGDQDLFEQMGGAYAGDAYPSVLYRNPGHGHAWVTLRLIGVESNRSGFGARIRVAVETRDGPRDVRVVAGTGGSFGGSSVQQEIGLGETSSIREIEIDWPTSGRRQVFRDVEPNRFYEVRENLDELVPLKRPPFTIGPP